MGCRITVTLTPDSSYDDNDAVEGEVHGGEQLNGDPSTLCGLHFVDGLETHDTRKPITCVACINVLEQRRKFTKRNGKWY